MNILITSAGRRVSLVQAFQQECKKSLGDNTKVLTADLAPEFSSACIRSHQSFRVGRFADPDYADVLLRVCMENDVKLVIPTIDTELKIMSAHRAQFEERGISSVVSDLDFVSICRDKRLTNQFFLDREVEVPPIIDMNSPRFPVFIKPVDGSSSKNIFLVQDESMLAPFMKDTNRFMHLEYLSPKEHSEYTVDMYYSRHGELKCLVPRVRLETRGGEVSKGVTRKDAVLHFVKDRFSTIEGARGCITLQLMYNRNQNRFFGIEINPRFGGGYPISYHAGANYAKFLIDEYLLGKDIEYFDSWEPDLMVLRYDEDIVVHQNATIV